VIIVAAIVVCLQACLIVVAWNFVLAFGPIFLAMYAFEKTEKYALHWLESVLKYTFALIVLVVLYDIFATQLTTAVTGLKDTYLSATSDVGGYLKASLIPIAIGIVSAYILTRADQLAQDLIGGGISGSGGFAQSMAGRLTGAAKSVVGAAGSAAGLAYAGTLGKGHTSPLSQWKDNKRSDAADDRKKAREKKSNPASSMLRAANRNAR